MWLIFIALTGAAGAYFTSIGCRWAHGRHHRPSWRYGWLASFITALLAVLFVCQGDLFRPGRWDTGKVSIWFSVVSVAIAAGIVALLASAIVLEVFWRKFKHEKIDP
jgi:hypothetical protein